MGSRGPEHGSVAANYGYAPTPAQRAKAFGINTIGLGFFDANPDMFSDDAVNVNFSPINGVLSAAVPGFGLASTAVDGMFGVNVDGVLGTSIGMGPASGLSGEVGANATDGNGPAGGNGPTGGPAGGGQQGAPGPGSALAAIPTPSNPVIPGRPPLSPPQQGYWDGNRFVIPGLLG